jgi:hypothetical protein
MDSTRELKARFSKTWPTGKEYYMAGFSYFNTKFINVDGYNWWLLPCVDEKGDPKYMGTFYEGDVTMKFTLGELCTSSMLVSTTPKIGVLVETNEHLYHVYMDEDANVFIDDDSDVCVGKVNIKMKIWDGTVSLDTDLIHREYSYRVGKPNDWYNY